MNQGVLNDPLADEALITERSRRKAGKAPEPHATHEARAWVACEKRRRNLEKLLASAVKDQDRARQALLEMWSLEGLSSESVDGQTVHLKRKLYPKVASKAALTEALKREELNDLLIADERAFATYVTDCDEASVALPDSIAALISDSYERWDVALRSKSGGQQ